MSKETVSNEMEMMYRHPIQQSNISLRECVQRLVQKHLATMGAKNTKNLYEIILQEMEQALIERVLDYTDGNESRTAKILGISRGTLRQRRKIFGHYDRAGSRERSDFDTFATDEFSTVSENFSDAN